MAPRAAADISPQTSAQPITVLDSNAPYEGGQKRQLNHLFAPDVACPCPRVSAHILPRVGTAPLAHGANVASPVLRGLAPLPTLSDRCRRLYAFFARTVCYCSNSSFTL